LRVQFVGKNKVVQFFVLGFQYFVFCTGPFFFAITDKKDRFANFNHRVHIVGVDDGGHLKFFGERLDEFVDYSSGFGVEA
jgi:hypothetical protein